MFICERCGAANWEGSRFCGTCGSPLSRGEGGSRCPMCEEINPPGSVYCRACGARLQPAEPAASEMEEDLGEWQRRQEAGLRKMGPAHEEEKPIGGLPGWVERLRASVPADLAPPPGEERETREPLEKGEQGAAEEGSPGWVGDLRSIGLGGEGTPEGEILAGIRGTLPVEPILAWPHLPREVSPKTQAASGQAEALQEVVAQRMATEGQILARRARRGVSAWGYRAIFGLILLAVVAPLLLRADWSGASISVSPPVGGFFDALDALPPGSTVLVSFDYDPATSEEMNLQAQAILGHLMRKEARILAMSLTPQGPALAQRALSSAAAKHASAGTGVDTYFNLGYLSGNEAALRTLLSQGFAASFPLAYPGGKPTGEAPALRGLGSLKDVEAIVDIAGDVRFVRWWVEQVGSQVESPLLVGVSGAGLVEVEPYYKSGQLKGVLGGIAGAAEYEIATNRPGLAVANMDSQSAVHLLVAFLILVGNLVYLFGSSREGS